MTLIKNNTINAFDELLNSLPTSWGKDAQTGYPTASVNIHETDDAYHLELNAPGREKADFSIKLDNNVLTVSTEKKEEPTVENEKLIRSEFGLKSFKRSFTLNEKIDTENIAARYENGILKIELPKKESFNAGAKDINIL